MRTSESYGRDALRLIVWYPLRWLLTLLPIKPAIFVLRSLGNIHYSVAKRKRQTLLKNLLLTGATKDTKEAQKQTRIYFQNHYLDQLFPIIFPKFNAQNIDNYVSIKGISNLDKALQHQKGILLIHGHFGPVHLPLLTLALKGYAMKQIGNPSSKGLSWIGLHVAFRLRMFYEALIPAEIIKATSFLRPVFNALRQNQIIMTTGDGSGTEVTYGKHAQFTFLGQPVSLPLGPAILARKTEATLLPLFIIPSETTAFSFTIGKPIISDLSGEQGVLDCTDHFNRQFEKLIHTTPGFWHFLDRFSPGQLIDTIQESEKSS